MKRRKILIAVTGTGVYPDGKLRTGLWLSELTHIYDSAQKRGYETVVASPKGGDTPVDPVSLRPIYLDKLSKGYWESPEFRDMLRHTKRLDEVAGQLFDCIYLAGGHGSMFDFPDDTMLQTLVRDHYEHGKMVCAICHGVCGLLNVKLSDGRYLIKGRTLTGFSWLEERLAGRSKVVPFNLEAALKERGANYRKALIPTVPEVVVDGDLITGEDPFSSRKMARIVMLQFDKRQKNMNLEEALNFRRAVRVFDKNKPIDPEKVKHCLELAALAPSSSNMQLWEVYEITEPKLMSEISHACLDQKATATASEIVVFVTRQDLYRQHARAVLDFERGNVRRNSPKERQDKRIRDRELYYGELMPFIYARFFGILGAFRAFLAWCIGLFRPMMRQVSECDMRVVVHKSCALAAQTFMIAMATEGYDTCPLEGIDSRRIKKLLKLPRRAGINLVIPCGIRDGVKGIWGERYRVPFDEVYHRI